MASAARSASRAFLRSSGVRPAARSARFALPAQVRASTRRGYASEAPAGKSSSFGIWGIGLAVAGGAGAYFYLNGEATPKGPFVPTQADYQKVYDAIADRLANETDYDDGSYGPVSSSIPKALTRITSADNISYLRFLFVLPGTPVVPTIRRPVPVAATVPP